MDPLSATAKTITFLRLLASSTKAAQNIWGGPDELQRLTTELSEFNELENKLDVLTRDQAFRNNDRHSAQAPYLKLREAQCVFEERLSTRHDSDSPAPRFRRRTWILHRTRIRKVTRDVTAVSTHLSNVIHSLTL